MLGIGACACGRLVPGSSSYHRSKFGFSYPHAGKLSCAIQTRHLKVVVFIVEKRRTMYIAMKNPWYYKKKKRDKQRGRYVICNFVIHISL